MTKRFLNQKLTDPKYKQKIKFKNGVITLLIFIVTKVCISVTLSPMASWATFIDGLYY